jgi:putative exporter of polyketide antibiotics
MRDRFWNALEALWLAFVVGVVCVRLRLRRRLP